MLRTPLISVCVCSHWELNHQSLAVENRSEKQSAAAFCLPRLLREYRTWCAAHHLYSRSIYGAGRVMKELINRAPACLPEPEKDFERPRERKMPHRSITYSQMMHFGEWDVAALETRSWRRLATLKYFQLVCRDARIICIILSQEFAQIGSGQQLFL